MKTLLIAIFCLPLLAMSQEENEILNTANKPSGLNPLNDNLLRSNILKDISKYTDSPIPEPTIARNKIASPKDLLISSKYREINEVQEEPTDPVEEERQASEKRINDAVIELRKLGTQAAQSTTPDLTETVISYKEYGKYKQSGVFDELGYTRGIDNDAIYNERLKWYGGLDSGFVMNIVGSFMETILSLPKLINTLFGR